MVGAPDSPALEAVKLMAEKGIHRVLVVDEGRAVGIVTAMDVVRAVAAGSFG